MSQPLVLIEEHGPIAVLTLNRPERRNALSRALVNELSDSIDKLAADPTLRALVLTGNGPTFCAGMDLKEASEPSETQAVGDTQAIADLMHRVHTFPRPTIAAAQGDALAGGAGLALACDFVLMADGASLGFPEVRRGLVAAIVLHDLVRHVGDRRARDLLLTGRSIPAVEAERWGLINTVVPAASCRDEAMALARSLLASAPIATTTTKRLLDEASSLPSNLRGAAAISAAARVGDEAGEGMAAFFEKRAAAWDH
ncbi:MAG: enoyl-CoA hydratase/carnithine racemase [Planctomycetota bacterium]|nr:enoyl-CoA hydratase/carnithine racemase [Planctomycetota bacterium]